MGDALWRYRMRAVYVAAPPPPPVEQLLTTRTLTNTSGSTQAGGFVAPKFGIGFAKGDIPTGEYPQFKKTDGTVLPATIMSLSHYDDGSVRMCTVMVRWPDSIAGSGTATIDVWSGGSAPSAASVDETDITATDIKHELVGVVNLTGTWTAECNTGITAADFDIIGTGPAGASYRIRAPFNNGSSDHEQLRCWFYVDVLQDASSGLAGLRYATRPINGFADHSTDMARLTVESRVLEGASERKAQQGYNTTETLGDSIALPHFASLFGVNDDGTNFFVAGTQATECTIRVTLDTDAKEYLRASGLVPPWDLTISPTATSAYTYYPMGLAPFTTRDNDHTGDSIEVGLVPSFNSKHFVSQAANDERASRVASLLLGSWRSSARRKATEQPVPSTTATYTGLTSQGAWYFAASALNNTGYVNPASNSSLWLGESTPSHRPEPHFYAYLMFGEQYTLDMLVENAYTIVAHTLTGTTTPNPVYDDPITGAFVNGSLSTRHYSVDGVPFECVISPFGGNANRWCAWALRDVTHAIACLPTTEPTGADLVGFLNDVVENTIAFNQAYLAIMPSTRADHGIVDFTSDGLGSSCWTFSYLYMAVSHARKLLGERTDVVWYHDHMSKQLEWWADTVGLWNFTAFYQMNRGTGSPGTRIESLADGLALWARGSISYDAGTDLFTCTSGGTDGNLNFDPTNGDIIAFGSPYDSSKPYTIGDRVFQYVVNASGKTFQLSDTLGGSPKDVTSTGAVTSFWGRIQNPSPSFSAWGKTTLGGLDPGNVNYLIPMAIRHGAAAGSTGVVTALSQAETLLTAAKGGSEPSWQNSNNKWTVVSSV